MCNTLFLPIHKRYLEKKKKKKKYRKKIKKNKKMLHLKVN